MLLNRRYCFKYLKLHIAKVLSFKSNGIFVFVFALFNNCQNVLSCLSFKNCDNFLNILNNFIILIDIFVLILLLIRTRLYYKSYFLFIFFVVVS